MLHLEARIVVVYLIACGTAWLLHELAHYTVHSIHAESVNFGFNRWGPYTESVYTDSAPTYTMRLGSIAPTLIFAPIVLLALLWYVQMFSIPRLDLVEWSFVVTPLVILITPTAADIYGCLYAHRMRGS